MSEVEQKGAQKGSFFDVRQINWDSDDAKITECCYCEEEKSCIQLVHNSAGNFENVNHSDWFPNWDTTKEWWCYQCFDKKNKERELRKLQYESRGRMAALQLKLIKIIHEVKNLTDAEALTVLNRLSEGYLKYLRKETLYEIASLHGEMEDE